MVYEYELSADFDCNVGTFVDIFFVDCSFPVVVNDIDGIVVVNIE